MSAFVVYHNARGGMYAVQDRVRTAAGNGGKSAVWWAPCYRAPGSAQWVKVPGASWHERLKDAQEELDALAVGKQLTPARFGA